jgi:hypothetical protein
MSAKITGVFFLTVNFIIHYELECEGITMLGAALSTNTTNVEPLESLYVE